MLEDIKNEVLEKAIHIETKKGKQKYDNYVIGVEDFKNTINKYKDIDKYKNAWEELKNKFNKYTTTVSDTMEELEQKHNISKEME